MNDDRYHDVAHALVAVVLQQCEREAGGLPKIEHFRENDMGCVPDMLARLGIMQATHLGMAHEFIVDWTPDDKLPIVRHQGEPSLADLLSGVEFYLEWFPKQQNGLAELAVAHGRGALIEGKYLSASNDKLGVIFPYHVSRPDMIISLGGNEAELYPAGLES